MTIEQWIIMGFAAFGVIVFISYVIDVVKQRLHRLDDDNALPWPDSYDDGKPKRTEYRLTEDGELDSDFPVDEKSWVNWSPEDLADYNRRVADSYPEYDKSKVDPFAGARYVPYGYISGISAYPVNVGRARESMWHTGYPTAMNTAIEMTPELQAKVDAMLAEARRRANVPENKPRGIESDTLHE